jgi:hypothetical protein
MIRVETVRPVRTADVILIARGRRGTMVTVVAKDCTEAYVESADFVAVTVHVPERSAFNTSPLMKHPAVPMVVTA